MSAVEHVDLGDGAARLQELCVERGITVAAAESCTGGLFSATLTGISGSSGYFLGGVVCYADSAKIAFLDVPSTLVESHGAVSAQVARAMAVGARARFGASIAVAVTGIAGPDGGTAQKPVGLTYLGIADERASDVRRIVWDGDRDFNRRASVGALLAWLIEWVAGHEQPDAGGAAPA